MKVYKKWLVLGSVNDHSRVATSFTTKAEAVSILNKTFKKLGDNLWEDSMGQRFYIEKNIKEYK